MGISAHVGEAWNCSPKFGKSSIDRYSPDATMSEQTLVTTLGMRWQPFHGSPVERGLSGAEGIYVRADLDDVRADVESAT